MNESIKPIIKEQEYRRVVGFEPDAVFILSGGVSKKINEDGELIESSTLYSDSDNFGMLGGHYRIQAAVEIAKIFPNASIYTLSQNEQLGQISWRVYKDELIQNGVDPDRISSIPDPATTAEELLQIVKEAMSQNLQNVTILTNDYHVSRAGLMLDVLEYFAKNKETIDLINNYRHSNVELRLLAAEKILEIKDPEFRKFYNSIKKTPEAIKRNENEYKGSYRLIVDPAGYINGNS